MTIEEPKFISGHKTLIDGTHVPLTEAEARELWAEADRAKEARAALMPTARDALSLLVDAETRLRELGWSRGGGFKVRRGDDCAVAEQGSTGMWRGHVDTEGKYVHYCDCVSEPRKAFLKPLYELTDDERAHMEQCDANERIAHDAELRRLSLAFGYLAQQEHINDDT